jgi:homospermidine synthase
MKNFPKLAQELNIRVIHISERDTQITNKPKEVNEFVNTWSPEGFYEEGVAPTELGWGIVLTINSSFVFCLFTQLNKITTT